jgi:hypothetical protein
MTLFIIWLTLIIILLVVANRRGRGPVVLSVLAAVLSFVLTIITPWWYVGFVLLLCLLPIVALMPPDKRLSRREIIAKLAEIRTCPACAETVKREAKICKHCHSELPPLPVAVGISP